MQFVGELMKKGHRVKMLFKHMPDLKGTIIDVRNRWSKDNVDYLIEYDQKDLIPPSDWHKSFEFMLINEPSIITKDPVECDCGATSIGCGSHAYWCSINKNN